MPWGIWLLLFTNNITDQVPGNILYQVYDNTINWYLATSLIRYLETHIARYPINYIYHQVPRNITYQLPNNITYMIHDTYMATVLSSLWFWRYLQNHSIQQCIKQVNQLPILQLFQLAIAKHNMYQTRLNSAVFLKTQRFCLKCFS